MAYTVTRYRTVFGNKAVVGLDITADAATQTIDCGLTAIEWISTGLQSMTTNDINVAVNSNASGVQSMGVIGLSGLTSGDRLFMTVFGH